MTDTDNLSAEQWRMARQAGAAFRDEDPTAVETPFGQQLTIPGTGPQLGGLWRNRHTGEMGCVVKLRQGRHGWVTLRAGGRVTEIPVGWLGDHWQECRPDGTVR